MKIRRTLYISDFCLSPREKVPRSGILCENDKILAVGGISAFSRDPDMKVIDLTGNYAIPGFIDTHTHGAGGFDSSTAFEPGADIERMCRTLRLARNHVIHPDHGFGPAQIHARMRFRAGQYDRGAATTAPSRWASTSKARFSIPKNMAPRILRMFSA